MPYRTETYIETIVKTVETPAWNAGARSISSFNYDGQFTFQVGQSIGIVCGLNTQDLSTSVNEIQHGFLINNTQYKIIESGVAKTSFNNYTKNQIFKIKRIGLNIYYYLDSTLIYISTKNSVGRVFLDCSMFAYLDTIQNATMSDYGKTLLSGLILPSLLVFGSTEFTIDGVNILSGFLPKLTIEIIEQDTNKLNFELPKLKTVGATDEVNFVVENLPKLIINLELDLNKERILTEFPILEVFGVSGELNFINVHLPSLFAEGYDVVDFFEINTLYIELPQLNIFSYVKDADISLLEFELPSLFTKGSTVEYNELNIVLPTLFIECYLDVLGQLVFTWPEWIVTATQTLATVSKHEIKYGQIVIKIDYQTYGSSKNLILIDHTTLWKSYVLTAHLSTWYSTTTTITIKSHDTLWNSVGSSFTIKSHDTFWNSVGSSFTIKSHNTFWNSVGSSFTIKSHDTLWNSVGSSFTIKEHTILWNSVGSSFTIKEHTILWNSVGSSFTIKSHNTLWNSVGSSFTIKSHDVFWSWQPQTIKAHTTFWKSIIEITTSHEVKWSDSTNLPTSHTTYYRSVDLSPIYIFNDIYVLINNKRIEINFVNITADEQSPYYQGTMELTDPQNYSLFPRNTAYIVVLLDVEFHFIVDRRELSRTVDAEGNILTNITISGLSPLSNYDKPRSTPLTKTWESALNASTIVTELLGTVTWNLIDWQIPAFRLAADNATPLTIAKQVVNAVGGVIESQPDGSVVIRSLWPTPINEIAITTPEHTILDRIIFNVKESPANDEWLNKVRILDIEGSYQDQMEFIKDELNPWNGVLNVYLSPWRENTRVVTTRPSVILLGDREEKTEEIIETVTFVNRTSNTSHPIMQLQNVTWLDENLGSVVTSNYSVTLKAGNGQYQGYSLAKIVYTTRYWQYPIQCQPSDKEIVSQLLLLEQ